MDGLLTLPERFCEDVDGRDAELRFCVLGRETLPRDCALGLLTDPLERDGADDLPMDEPLERDGADDLPMDDPPELLIEEPPERPTEAPPERDAPPPLPRLTEEDGRPLPPPLDCA